MKIDSSTVSMDSGRFYANNTQVTQETISTNLSTGAVRYSGTSFLSTYAEYSGTANNNTALDQYDSYLSSMNSSDSFATPLSSDLYTNLANNRLNIDRAKTTYEKFHEEFIKRMEELMDRIRNQLLGVKWNEDHAIVDVTSTSNQPGAFWTKETHESITVSETETTSFSSTGTVVTSDGRTIDFNVSMEMSRSFTETVESISSETQYILTDPLVIQLDNAPETISDQKWFFDIDGDGEKEEISELSKGNGFLALDKNGNGIIDDGNELFGTQSGNGFKDLAEYDDDGNGWIDENDAIYDKLKIWAKDASGKDKLMSLQQADVGAIYLGSAATRFSHNNSENNETQAVVQQTGFYLHESTGQAGIIQQIDFAVKQDSVA
ncbi:MAG: hypothetical protein IJD40_11030 [Lachnospiraceae bacterium]|nr:hypothetical protein [Lachnospiraceae bacterium]